VTEVDVAPADWRTAAVAARDDPGTECDFFDWLSAYEDAAELVVVAHLWSVRRRAHVFLRTRLPADAPRLDSLTGVWPGADWHERETFEMFGVVFDGHPDLRPLLLPDGFVGRPLRKDFPLGGRQVRPWPGAVDPADDHRETPE
jgi:NADH-quinone oxidoreductase subunit C